MAKNRGWRDREHGGPRADDHHGGPEILIGHAGKKDEFEINRDDHGPVTIVKYSFADRDLLDLTVPATGPRNRPWGC